MARRKKRVTMKEHITAAVEQTEKAFIEALQEVMPRLLEEVVHARENQVHMELGPMPTDLKERLGLNPDPLRSRYDETDHMFTGPTPVDEPEPDDPWAHRSRGMRCISCMFYVTKTDEDIPELVREKGRCRRRAPTMNGYPVVFPSDWCGDHKLA